MLKTEIEILATIFFNRYTGRQTINERLSRHYNPYVVSSLKTLKEKGYIVEHQIKRYVVTAEGTKALKEYHPYSLDGGSATRQSSKPKNEVNNTIRMKELGY